MADIYEQIEQEQERQENGNYCLYSPMPVFCETKNCKKCSFYNKNE